MILHGKNLADALGLGSTEARLKDWRCAQIHANEHGGWNFPLEGPEDQRVTLAIAPHDESRPAWRRVGSLSLSYTRMRGSEDRIRPVLESLAERLERARLPAASTDSVHGHDTFLGALFSLGDPGEFFQNNWSLAPLHVPGSLDRLGELNEAPALSSWEALLRAHTGESVGTWVNDAGIPREEPIPREQISSRRDDGWVTTLLHIERDVPVVAQWCQAFANALQTAPGSVRCASFSANPGHGVCKHWDADDLFLVQLRGAKRWRIASNQDIEHPTTNCLPPHASAELKRYSDATFTTKMPTDALSLTLNAGDVLYLPRATWHTTEDSADSLSLSFAVSRPSWMHVILEALEDQLIQAPEWREAAWSGAPPEKIRELLKRLPADWDGLDPAGILERLTRRRR